jgi:hypothetical protein
MWPTHFAQRLNAWNQLRTQASTMSTDTVLAEINQWWFRAPWTAYHLHWDDRQNWPDPWQLLDDNIYCSLARALGIMYTIVLLDREDIHDAKLIEFDSDNLVLVSNRKYILNWDPTEIVNINPGIEKSSKLVTQDEIKQQLR